MHPFPISSPAELRSREIFPISSKSPKFKSCGSMFRSDFHKSIFDGNSSDYLTARGILVTRMDFDDLTRLNFVGKSWLKIKVIHPRYTNYVLF